MKGTKGFGILYIATNDFKLVGYINSNWTRSIVDRKSTSRYVFHMRLGVISWASKKQPIVPKSIAKAEYRATNTIAYQTI